MLQRQVAPFAPLSELCGQSANDPPKAHVHSRGSANIPCQRALSGPPRRSRVVAFPALKPLTAVGLSLTHYTETCALNWSVVRR